MADTSYGVYLTHVLILLPVTAWFVQHPGFVHLAPMRRYTLLLITMVAIAYPVAFLIHKLIERPGIAVGKNLIRRIRVQQLKPLENPSIEVPPPVTAS